MIITIIIIIIIIIIITEVNLGWRVKWNQPSAFNQVPLDCAARTSLITSPDPVNLARAGPRTQCLKQCLRMCLVSGQREGQGIHTWRSRIASWHWTWGTQSISSTVDSTGFVTIWIWGTSAERAP